jgi:dihydrofolate reductase
MRRIIVSEMISIDGRFAGPGGDIDWHVVDDDFNQFAVDLLQHVDTILFGRVTFELFEAYWPTATDDPTTTPADTVIAGAINAATKIVFSRSPLETKWGGTQVWTSVDAAAIADLKRQPGKDIVVYGSGTIVRELAEFGLIDEYLLVVAPVVLGEGPALFDGLDEHLQLRLAEARPFGTSGNVLLRYLP